MALVFDTCCGCIELRTGCLIIGYLQLVGEVIGTIMFGLGITAGGVLAGAGDTEEMRLAGLVMLVLSAIMLIFILLALAFTIALLVGVHQEKRGHIKAYLIYAAIFFVISVIMFFASFAQKPILVQNVIANIIAIVLNLYFLLVIRSHFIKLGDGSKGPYGTA